MHRLVSAPAALLLLLAGATAASAQTYPAPTFRSLLLSGTPSFTVVPTDAPFSGITSMLSLQYTASTPGTSPWLQNIGLFTTGQSSSDVVVGSYIAAAQGPNSAATWAFNTNFLRGSKNIAGNYPDVLGSNVVNNNTSINYELDYSNADGDCYVAPCFTVGFYLHNQSPYTSKAAMYLDATNQSADPNKRMWNSGLLMYGAAVNLATDVELITAATNAVKVSGNRTISMQFNTAATNNAIYIQDPPALWGAIPRSSTQASGVSDISVSTTSPIAVQLAGTHATASITDTSTAPLGLRFTGTYSSGEIYANGTSGSGFITGGTKTRNDIWLPTSAPIGVEISGTRATSGIRDGSVTPEGVLFQGTYSLGEIYANGSSAHALVSGGTKTGSDIWLPTAGPLAIDISGTRSIAAIKDTSTTPIGVTLRGTYSGAAISTTTATVTSAIQVADGQQVCFSSADACLVHSGGKLLYIVGGVNMFSVADTTGNAIFKGTVTASGSP